MFIYLIYIEIRDTIINLSSSCEFIIEESLNVVSYSHDITDECTLDDVFDVIIHAAGYKGPVECTKNPECALRCNIIGTFNMLSVSAVASPVKLPVGKTGPLEMNFFLNY